MSSFEELPEHLKWEVLDLSSGALPVRNDFVDGGVTYLDGLVGRADESGLLASIRGIAAAATGFGINDYERDFLYGTALGIKVVHTSTESLPEAFQKSFDEQLVDMQSETALAKVIVGRRHLYLRDIAREGLQAHPETYPLLRTLGLLWKAEGNVNPVDVESGLGFVLRSFDIFYEAEREAVISKIVEDSFSVTSIERFLGAEQDANQADEYTSMEEDGAWDDNPDEEQ